MKLRVPPSSLKNMAMVFLVALLWFAATAWIRPLMLPDEGRYAGVAWEMVRSGNWIVPTLDGLPFFHKPPLFYWITGAALQAFGPHELPARAASIFGGTIGLVAMYAFIRRWVGQREAYLSALVFAVQPLCFLGSQFANLDMLVAGCITLTICLLAHVVLILESGQPSGKLLVAAYASAALGMLAKGLIGVVLPGMVIVVWLTFRGRWKIMLSLISIPGIVIFLAIASPWFVQMERYFPNFVHYFFITQQFTRFTGSGFNNIAPFWFYPAVLLATSIPFFAWIDWREVTRVLQRWNSDPVLLLMLVWIACIVGFFSIPQSKLVGYVFPVMAPVAFLIAVSFARRPTALHPQRNRALLAASLTVCVLVGFFAVALIASRPGGSTRLLARELARSRQADETVNMVGSYYYDLGFYSGHALDGMIVSVVDDWSEANAMARDNWRKELFESGKFAPELAAARLIDHGSLSRTLRDRQVSWIVGPESLQQSLTELCGVAPVTREDGIALWRLTRDRLASDAFNACTRKPNIG